MATSTHFGVNRIAGASVESCINSVLQDALSCLPQHQGDMGWGAGVLELFGWVPVCMASCRLPECVSVVQAEAYAPRIAFHTTAKFIEATQRAFR